MGSDKICSRSLNIVIKKVDKGSCVIIWDRNDDFITEIEKQLSGKDIYKEVSFKEKDAVWLLRDK